MSNNTDENLTFSTSQKVFNPSKWTATQIVSIDPLLYVGHDGSVFEISKNESSPLFQKYILLVSPDDEPEYEVCKQCGHIHNDISFRSYYDTKTSINVISEFGKGKVMEPI